jgi:tryptophan-rich sensory protein
VKALVLFLCFLFVCFGTAAVGGYVTSTTVSTWYPQLHKPTWTPSGQTIGRVWSVLYFLMALAGWLVWKQAGFTTRSRMAMIAFAIQLGLNLLWSVCFFGLQSPGLAVIELLILEAAIIWTLVLFGKIHYGAAVLFVPYAMWVAFAGVLNANIWWLNRMNGFSG